MIENRTVTTPINTHRPTFALGRGNPPVKGPPPLPPQSLSPPRPVSRGVAFTGGAALAARPASILPRATTRGVASTYDRALMPHPPRRAALHGRCRRLPRPVREFLDGKNSRGPGPRNPKPRD